MHNGQRPRLLSGIYVLVIGLQGGPWNDCKGEEKKAPALNRRDLRPPGATIGPVKFRVDDEPHGSESVSLIFSRSPRLRRYT